MSQQPPKKDKQKVTEEVFTQEMLQHFLKDPVSSEDSLDFRRLLFAYRGMPAEAFEQYLPLFVKAGFDLNAQDAQGRSFVEYLERFPAHGDSLAVFKKALS